MHESSAPHDGKPRVAVIGSFRQHYAEVLRTLEEFRHHGWTITSPAGSDVLEPGIDFVRFATDDPLQSDALVQSVTLANIFTADLVYVVAPSGYVGRTTCYELGRILQRDQPLYFSEHPVDLPLEVPDSHVRAPAELVAVVNDEGVGSLTSALTGEGSLVEQGLVDGSPPARGR